jgi:hypothetical protein
MSDAALPVAPVGVWVQLLVGDEKQGESFEIEQTPRNVNALKVAVFPELTPREVAKCFVFAPSADPRTDTALKANALVPSNATYENPLIVVAPNLTSSAMLRKQKGGGGGGGKKGAKRNDRPQSFWYALCETFENGLNENRWKTQTDFLRSSSFATTAAGATITTTTSTTVNPKDKMAFSRALKKFRNGKLKNVKASRVRARKFEDVAEYLVEYYIASLQQDERMCAFRQQRNKCGAAVSWGILQEKAIAFAKSKGYPTDENDPDAFKASPGWISNVLKRGNLVPIARHGKAADLTDSEAAELILH